MPQTENTTEPGAPKLYQIRVTGHLGRRWERWFEHMTIDPQADGNTLLTGPVIDQAALHGLLTRIRDLGLALVSVMEVDARPANAPDVDADTDRDHSTSARCGTST